MKGVICYLVGAGPGASDLLTLRAERILRQADVVIYDRLIAPEVLEHAPRHAERIYIQHHDWTPGQLVQPSVKGYSPNAEKSLKLLVRVCRHFQIQWSNQTLHHPSNHLLKPPLKALATPYHGKLSSSPAVLGLEADPSKPSSRPSSKPYSIVRLKGGDPLIFARAQEEMEALVKAGVPFAVVPGISSFAAAAACATIPLTRRKGSQSFSVLTGHFSKEDEAAKRKVIATSDTVVYLMGVKNLKRIIDENLRAGKAPQTPIAVIEEASLPHERVRVATLTTLLKSHEKQPIVHPAVLIIGKVAAYRKRFTQHITQHVQNRPNENDSEENHSEENNKENNFKRNKGNLSEMTLGLMRAGAELPELRALIENLGGRTMALPLIRHSVVRVYEEELVNSLLSRRFKVMIFTSRRAVERVFSILEARRVDIRVWGQLKIVAIGVGTAASLGRYGIWADWTASDASQEGVRDVIVRERLNDILLPQSQNARPWLAHWLEGRQGMEHTQALEKPGVTDVFEEIKEKKGVKMMRKEEKTENHIKTRSIEKIRERKEVKGKKYRYQVLPLYKTIPTAAKDLLDPIFFKQLQACDVLLITSTSALMGLIAYVKHHKHVLYRKNWWMKRHAGDVKGSKTQTTKGAKGKNTRLKESLLAEDAIESDTLTSSRRKESNTKALSAKSSVMLGERVQTPLPILIAMSAELEVKCRAYFEEYFTQILLKERNQVKKIGEFGDGDVMKGVPFDVDQYFMHAAKGHYKSLVAVAGVLRKKLPYFTP